MAWDFWQLCGWYGPRTSINDRDANGPLLHWAVQHKPHRPHVLGPVLAAGPDLEAQDNEGWTALQRACAEGWGVRALLQAGADPHTRVNGLTPLDLARTVHAVQCLLAVPVDIHAVSDLGHSVLHQVCRDARPETATDVLENLLIAGADPTLLDHLGWPAVWFAAEHDWVAGVAALHRHAPSCLRRDAGDRQGLWLADIAGPQVRRWLNALAMEEALGTGPARSRSRL